jgi:hypothetical protein
VSRHKRRGPLMELERRHEPMLPYPVFLRRLVRSVMVGAAIIFGSLAIGVVGYRWTGGLGWLDSLYNASMILGGMGPVDDRGLGIPAAEKWFASAYALFAGMALLVIVGVMFAPLFHRFLHHFHLVDDEEKKAR